MPDRPGCAEPSRAELFLRGMLMIEEAVQPGERSVLDDVG